MSLTGGGSGFISADEVEGLMIDGAQRGANLANQNIIAVITAIEADGPPGSHAERKSQFRGACAVYVAGRLLTETARERLAMCSTSADLSIALDHLVDIFIANRTSKPDQEHEEPSRN